MKWMLVLLSLLSFTAQAEWKAEFIMSKEHCTLLKQHAIQAITAKTAGVDYSSYLRERVEDYTKLTGKDRVIYLDILPFTLDMAYEYFNNDFQLTTPYEEVIEKNCLERLGDAAP